jgi:hypothetical protein
MPSVPFVIPNSPSAIIVLLSPICKIYTPFHI